MKNHDHTCGLRLRTVRATPERTVAIISIPSFGEAVRTWAYIGLNSFGGPTGQIAVMHRVLVEEKRWISEERFLHALNYCMLLPGPEAQQLAVYIGWLLHGYRGGLVAGILFVVPGVAAIMALSWLYAGFQQIDLVQSLFFGLKAAVLAIVAEAVLRIGRRALKTRGMFVLAMAAFVAIFFFEAPFPLIIASAALIGLTRTWLMRQGGAEQPPTVGPGPSTATVPIVDAVLSTHATVSLRPTTLRSLKVGSACVVIWFLPLAVLFTMGKAQSVYFDIGTFFSKAAVVTFGGAYSVLAYVAQQAVATYGWLEPGEMLDGLAMAETTPGPLIMVVQFVGFMAGFRSPGTLNPLLAGTLAGLLTTWVTFAPCFLWIFLGAPYIEALRGNRALNGALSAITAAVVGVVLNLALWFTINTVFGTVRELHVWGARLLVPELATLNWGACLVAAMAVVATFKYHVGTIKILAGCALAGMLWNTLFP